MTQTSRVPEPLALPAFLMETGSTAPPDQVAAGLTLTGHFLERCIFAPDRRTLPPARVRFFDGFERSSISGGNG